MNSRTYHPAVGSFVTCNFLKNVLTFSTGLFTLGLCSVYALTALQIMRSLFTYNLLHLSFFANTNSHENMFVCILSHSSDGNGGT